MSTTKTPNMNLTVPGVGTEQGPDYANEINADLSLIDSHDHTPGNGAQLSQSSLAISGDLPLNNNSITEAKSVQFQNQSSLVADQAVYTIGGDLYYNNSSGTAVQITSGNSIVGTAGSIIGLPSGTASVVYNAGVYSFYSATNNPANVVGASFQLALNSTSSNRLTLSPPSSLSSGSYSLTLPSTPASTQVMSLDSSGNMGSIATTGTGSVVLSNSPTLTGTITCSTLSATASNGAIQLNPATSSAASFIAMNGGANLGTESSVGGNIITGAPAYALSIAPAVSRQLVLGYSGGAGTSISIDTSGYITMPKRLTVTDSSGAGISVSPSTTSTYAPLSFTNAGGSAVMGQESSAGGNIIIGTDPYAMSIAPAPSRKLVLGYSGGSGVALTVDTSGNVTIAKNATVSTNLTVTGTSSLVGTVSTTGNLNVGNILNFGFISSGGVDAITTTMTTAQANQIANTMDANGANPIANKRTRTVSSSAPAGGVAISTSTGVISIDGALTTVASVSLTSSSGGRPVKVSFMSDGDTTAGHYFEIYGGGAGVAWQILSGSTIIAQGTIGSAVTASSFTLDAIVVPAASSSNTFTIKMQGGTGSGAFVQYGRLVAYEL